MIQVFRLGGQKVGEAIVQSFTNRFVEPYCSNEIYTCTKFADGEMEVRFVESVRGNDVYFICSTTSPEVIMELLLACNAAHYASARTITAVIPYFGYARQDRKSVPRVSVGSRLMADILQAAGVTRVITMDLHAPQEQMFFHIPVDHVHATSVFIPALKQQDLTDTVIVAPDAGAAKNAEIYAKALNIPLVLCHKHRSAPNQVSEMVIIGDVRGKRCIVVDDMIDTAGTICKCAMALHDAGSADITVICSHALLSGQAVDRIAKSPIQTMLCTDSVCKVDSIPNTKLQVYSVADLFAGVILAAYRNESIEDLYAVASH